MRQPEERVRPSNGYLELEDFASGHDRENTAPRNAVHMCGSALRATARMLRQDALGVHGEAVRVPFYWNPFMEAVMFLGRTLAVIGVVGGAAWAVSKYLKAQRGNGAFAGNSAGDPAGGTEKSFSPGDNASRANPASGTGTAASSRPGTH
jgi:hypothetical protein